MKSTLPRKTTSILPNPLRPEIDLEQIKREFDTRGWKLIGRYVDRIEIHGLERIIPIIKQKSPWFSTFGPHTTQNDYPLPTYVVLRKGQPDLPFHHIVLGDNLKHPLVKKWSGVDYEKWGVIWRIRKGATKRDERNYLDAYTETYKEGFSVGVWAEGDNPKGARDRNFNGTVREFNPTVFKPILRVQRETEEDIYAIGWGIYHEKRPENGFRWLIDNQLPWKRLQRACYYAGDAIASLAWRIPFRNRGTIRVNFSEPVKLRDLAGSHDHTTQAKNVAEGMRDMVQRAYDEIAR